MQIEANKLARIGGNGGDDILAMFVATCGDNELKALKTFAWSSHVISISVQFISVPRTPDWPHRTMGQPLDLNSHAFSRVEYSTLSWPPRVHPLGVIIAICTMLSTLSFPKA